MKSGLSVLTLHCPRLEILQESEFAHVRVGASRAASFNLELKAMALYHKSRASNSFNCIFLSSIKEKTIVSDLNGDTVDMRYYCHRLKYGENSARQSVHRRTCWLMD